MFNHGGERRRAADHYGISVSDWLDLSTGINPNRWPAPAVPPTAWSRLPEDDDGLEDAARAYYEADTLLPVGGSQIALQTLPRLRPPCRVGVLQPGYAEHGLAWRRAGHTVTAFAPDALPSALAALDVLVLIHPNNPTGHCFNRDHLLHWHAQLAARGGWLVIDEAFMDVTPEHSLVKLTHLPGLIVLRSFGKFFGLAGARLGFLFADTPVCDAVREWTGPWAVNGPARFVATRALADTRWQRETRQRLERCSERLAELLTRHGLPPDGGCALFHWVCTPEAETLHIDLARRGILTRLFEHPASLRFGLPGAEADWTRLDAALAQART